MVLQESASGTQVAQLVDELRDLGFEIPATQLFDSGVRRAVEAFQSAHVDAAGEPLLVDGKVGMHTRWALDAILRGQVSEHGDYRMPALPEGGSQTGRAALRVALDERESGCGEVGGNNRGPDVGRYVDGRAVLPANWCAAFVSWCFRQALGHDPVFGYTLGAQTVHRRMKAAGCVYQASMAQPPQPGDVIVWRRADPGNPLATAWQGHVGLVYGFVDGYLWTVEGNRGGFPSRVRGFRYSWSVLATSANTERFKGLYGLSRHP